MYFLSECETHVKQGWEEVKFTVGTLTVSVYCATFPPKVFVLSNIHLACILWPTTVTHSPKIDIFGQGLFTIFARKKTSFDRLLASKIRGGTRMLEF